MNIKAELTRLIASGALPKTKQVQLHTDVLQAALDRIVELEAETTALKESINTPQIQDFLEAVKIEAAHQVQRWGENHDKEKTELDWFWLIGYLSTKATQAARYNDPDKYLHHIVTTAAACYNWHSAAVKS